MINRLFAAVGMTSLAMIGCGGGGFEPTKLTDEEKAKQMEALKQQRSDEWKSTLKKK
jgi:hypothetical protein